MVASVRPKTDPRTKAGACVKTPGGYRAFVLGRDPKDPKRVLIEYEAKSLGEDSYQPGMLTLVCEAPDSDEPEPKELPWIFIPDFLRGSAADYWLAYSRDLEWQQNEMPFFGKPVTLPRLEVAYGSGSYTYGKVSLVANPWTEKLALLRKIVQDATGFEFQIAIGNKYRSGLDHIGWHSDDSPEMGERPAIASLSLGETRKFQLKHKRSGEVHSFELTHGSLFVMLPGCQEAYLHRICKASENVGERINWTFRPLAVAGRAVSESNSEPEQAATALQDFSVGDRVCPAWQAGSDKLGEVIAIQAKGKRKPQYWAVVKWLEGRKEAIGTTSQVRFDQLAKVTESSALTIQQPEVIEGEIVPSASDQLAYCEDEIEAGRKLCQQGERRVWLALHQIRDQTLWQLPKDEDEQPLYKSFEDYCLARHGWQKSNAHEVAGSGAVIAGLLDSGAPEADLPTSIAQIRELKKAPPAERLAVIQEAKAAGKLTAEGIKQAIAQRQRSLPAAKPKQTETFTPIQPTPVWFELDGEVIEGQAVGTSRKGSVYIAYGEDEEIQIPGSRVSWQAPASAQVAPAEPHEPDPELPTVRLKVDQAKLEQLRRYLHGAIVQIGDTTFCLKPSDIRLEGL